MKNKCIYCDNMTTYETRHFQSACCGRGMCQTCFDNLQGTDEQAQFDSMDEEDYEMFVVKTGLEGRGDYACFDCLYKLTK